MAPSGHVVPDGRCARVGGVALDRPVTPQGSRRTDRGSSGRHRSLGAMCGRVRARGVRLVSSPCVGCPGIVVVIGPLVGGGSCDGVLCRGSRLVGVGRAWWSVLGPGVCGGWVSLVGWLPAGAAVLSGGVLLGFMVFVGAPRPTGVAGGRVRVVRRSSGGGLWPSYLLLGWWSPGRLGFWSAGASGWLWSGVSTMAGGRCSTCAAHSCRP